MKFLQEAVLGRVKYVKVPGGMKDEIRQEELYFALPKNSAWRCWTWCNNVFHVGWPSQLRSDNPMGCSY